MDTENPWEYAQALYLYCPVCKVCLGYRDSDSKVYRAHCNECKATFLFSKTEAIPFKAILDSPPKKTCSCLSCQGRNYQTNS